MKDRLEGAMVWLLLALTIGCAHLVGSWFIKIGYADSLYRNGVHAGPQDAINPNQ